MADNKHTPGPWKVLNTNRHQNIPITAGSKAVCTVWIPGFDRDVAIANAELIASAPTLLEQNKKMREALSVSLTVLRSHNDEVEGKFNWAIGVITEALK